MNEKLKEALRRTFKSFCVESLIDPDKDYKNTEEEFINSVINNLVEIENEQVDNVVNNLSQRKNNKSKGLYNPSYYFDQDDWPEDD